MTAHNRHATHPGAIVLADPKYPDQRESKTRPLLVISNNHFHLNTRYAVCLGITTNPESAPYLMQIPNTEVLDGRLKRDSQVICSRIATLRQSELYRIAKVTPRFYNKVLEKIKMDVVEWMLPEEGR